MIRQPTEMDFRDKNFSMLLYGSPGIGKTTLALSAPDPVLLDFDRGVSRVKAHHRKPTVTCDCYEEVLEDLQSPEVQACRTLVIDTGGSFVTCLQDWAMRQNPTAHRQKNGALSLKGFGAVKQEFLRFTGYVREILRKNIIFVFHTEEQRDKDGNPQQRLQCEGAARTLVWNPCDFGAYLQMMGNRRVLCFTPTEEFFAKGCYGIEGTREVPDLGMNDKNDLLSRLFEEARETIAAETAALAPLLAEYDAVMREVVRVVSAVQTVEDANAAAQTLPTLEHALTSKKEAGAMLQARAAELGFVWDRSVKAYRTGGTAG